MRTQIFSSGFFIIFLLAGVLTAQTTYKVVDTGQKKYYNNNTEITAPTVGQSFYGQDANYEGNQPSYADNGDGTITDNVTGLMWSKSYDLNGDGVKDTKDKMYTEQAIASTAACKIGGYTDWRIPTIKELYSLILFSGAEISPNATSTAGVVPFINTTYFDIGYGELSAGERLIDAQVATSTYYSNLTMNGNRTMFGTNFVDGRIKGYPADSSIGKKYYILYVRSNTEYGKNNFKDNNDETITDNATGLMWMKNDNGKGVIWEKALAFADSLNNIKYKGYSDWRLPNAKELQSIVDYSRCPDITNSPALNPLFNCTQITNEANKSDYACYWTSTTFCSERTSNGQAAVYVSFGRAMGYQSTYGWIDVHGAGAQRSDPKIGNPAQYPQGHGPQGDAIRILNYVRLVRDVNSATDVNDGESKNSLPNDFQLYQNYPNPFNPETVISYQIAPLNLPDKSGETSQHVTLKVYDVLGREIATLVNEYQQAGNYNVKFNLETRHQPRRDRVSTGASSLQSGVYFYRLQAGNFSETKKMLLVK